MRSKSRRFEVLLPVRFNDGTDVPDELLGEAVKEIVQQCGAVSFYKQAVEGQWRQDDILDHDELALVVVDVPDTAKNQKYRLETHTLPAFAPPVLTKSEPPNPFLPLTLRRGHRDKIEQEGLTRCPIGPILPMHLRAGAVPKRLVTLN